MVVSRNNVAQKHGKPGKPHSRNCASEVSYFREIGKLIFPQNIGLKSFPGFPGFPSGARNQKANLAANAQSLTGYSRDDDAARKLSGVGA
jgi:hypothetical protein